MCAVVPFYVRRHSTLSPNEVRAIRMVAGVPRDTFLRAIARRASGAWAKDADAAPDETRARGTSTGEST